MSPVFGVTYVSGSSVFKPLKTQEKAPPVALLAVARHRHPAKARPPPHRTDPAMEIMALMRIVGWLPELRNDRVIRE
jgi:hypothetical protein